MLYGLDREDVGFSYVTVKPEFGNQQFCLWAFGSGYYSRIVWLFETCSILWDLWWRRNCIEENIRYLCAVNVDNSIG